MAKSIGFALSVNEKEVQSMRQVSVSLARRWTKESRHFYALLKLWFARYRQRRQLARLPDHMLKDIGVSRYDAVQESRKSFWQV